MRNLDIADSRAKLELYASQGQLGGHAELVGSLEPGGAAAIESVGSDDELADEALELAAYEFGAD
jgi:argininosuccinate synthase